MTTVNWKQPIGLKKTDEIDLGPLLGYSMNHWDKFSCLISCYTFLETSKSIPERAGSPKHSISPLRYTVYIVEVKMTISNISRSLLCPIINYTNRSKNWVDIWVAYVLKHSIKTKMRFFKKKKWMKRPLVDNSLIIW